MTADIVLILGVALVVVLGQTLLKIGMGSVGFISVGRLRAMGGLAYRIARTPAVIAGLGLYAGAAVAWIIVLSRDDLSFAFPMLAVSYLGVPIAGILVLRERLRMVQYVGLVAIAVGVATVAASRGS